jgi:hypothetical protein
MAHNFKLTGELYVSKGGNDANPGTSPDLPKKTIAAAVAAAVAGNTIIIGTGQYAESNVGNITNKILRADGRVVVTGDGTNTFAQASANNSEYFRFYDITFTDFGNIVARIGGGGTPSYLFSRCILLNCSFSFDGYAGEINFQDTLFVDCGLIYFRGRNRSLERSISINSHFSHAGFDAGRVFTIAASYCDSLSTSRSADGTTYPITHSFSNVNFRGRYRNETIGDLVELAAGANNLKAEPYFNNEFAYDFSLKKNSPHLSTKIGPAWLRLGNGFYLKGPEGDITADSGHYFEGTANGTQYPIYYAENMIATLQNGQLRMKVKQAVNGSFIGKYRCKFKVSDVPVQLDRVDFAAGLNFNTDYPAAENLFDANNPEVFNNNVPNGFNWISGHEGRNPNRLDYSFRWSQKDNPDIAVDTDWITGNVRLIFEWGTVPMYNPISNRGNADPFFQVAPADTNDNPRNVIATWIDQEGTLMNNYFSL